MGGGGGGGLSIVGTFFMLQVYKNTKNVETSRVEVYKGSFKRG